MSLAQWFEDHARLYEGGTCHHRDTTFRYEPKNDKVALETARKKAAYDREHMFDGIRDALADAYTDVKLPARMAKLFEQRPTRNP